MRIATRELKPFAAAIAGGIGMIMTSYILLRELDAYPATFVTAHNYLLRGELGFQGVIVADDIGRHAASSIFEDRDAAGRFLFAGNDMLMIGAHWRDTEGARILTRVILVARRSGALDGQTRERFRNDSMLAHTTQHAVRKLPDATFRRHAASGPLFSSETVEII